MKITPTAILGYLFVAVGVLIVLESSHRLPGMVISLWGSAVVVSLGACLLLRKWVPRFESQDLLEQKQRKLSFIHFALMQSGLMVMTVFSTGLLERQTQLDARFDALTTGQFLGVLQRHPLSLGVLPFIVYAVCGIAIAYVTLIIKKQPFLFRLVLWSKKRNKAQYFLHNLTQIVLDLIQVGWMSILWSLTTVWFIEQVCQMMGWSSLFAVSLRTPFILGIMLVFLRKPNIQLIEWAGKAKPSLAVFSSIYMGIFAAFFLWLHFSCDWFLPVREAVVQKSHWVSNLSIQAIDTRMQLFILGWFALWIPWMSSWVARLSLGKSVIKTLACSMVVPVLGFMVLLPKLNTEVLMGLNTPQVQWLGLVLMIGFLITLTLPIRRILDVNKGAMPYHRAWHQGSLKPWLSKVVVWFNIVLLAWINLGWMVLQSVMTLGAVFAAIALCIITFSWVASIFHHTDEVKYKVQLSG